MSFFQSNNTGGGAFGGGNTGTSSNVFGGGAFGANPTGTAGNTTGAPPNNAPQTGGGLFNTTNAATPSGGGLFGSNTGTTAPSSGGIFGNAAAAPGGGGGFGNTNTANATTPSGGSLFGTATSGSTGTNPLGGAPTGSPAPNPLFGGASAAGGGIFGTAKPADQSAPKPAAPLNFFNQPSSSTAPSAGTAQGPSGGLFGTAPKAPDASSTVTNGTSGGGGLFGSLGKKPETPAGTPGAAPSAPTSLPAFNLGGTATSKNGTGTTPSAPSSFFNLTGNKAEDKKEAPAAPAFNLFGAPKDAATEKKDAPAASAPIFSLGGGSTAAKDSEKGKSTGNGSTGTQGPSAATTSAAISVPPPSMLRGKTIEEIVNRWSTDLETQVREFNKFAGEVAVWDRALIENGNNLASLYGAVLAAEREQNDIDQSLDHVEQQQRDLSSTLEAYEKSTEEILGGQSGSLRALDTGPADTERDKNYMLATELHDHLDDLSGSLMQMIESVNALSLPSGDSAKGAGEDPMGQIAQILNSHLESLQWIDGAVREVEGKIVDVEKRVRSASEAVNGTNLGGKSRGYGLGR